MRAGDLRHRVRIEERVVGRDDFGGEEDTWVEVGTVWGDIRPIKGRELIEGAQEEALLSTRIWIRHWRKVRQEMRVVWLDEIDQEHVFEIRSVIARGERRRSMELMCEEIV